MSHLEQESEPCHPGTPPSTYAHTQAPATSSLPTAICHVCQLQQTTNITQQGAHYSFLFSHRAFVEAHSLPERAAGRTGILHRGAVLSVATWPHQNLCTSATTVITAARESIPSSRDTGQLWDQPLKRLVAHLCGLFQEFSLFSLSVSLFQIIHLIDIFPGFPSQGKHPLDQIFKRYHSSVPPSHTSSPVISLVKYLIFQWSFLPLKLHKLFGTRDNFSTLEYSASSTARPPSQLLQYTTQKMEKRRRKNAGTQTNPFSPFLPEADAGGIFNVWGFADLHPCKNQYSKLLFMCSFHQVKGILHIKGSCTSHFRFISKSIEKTFPVK